MNEYDNINAGTVEIADIAEFENSAGFHEEVYDYDARIDKRKEEKQNAGDNQPAGYVNHVEDILIDNETTFFGLLDILRNRPEAVAAEREEIRIKEEEERDARKAALGEEFSEEYDRQYDRHMAPDRVYKDEFKKQSHRPGPAHLWNKYHRIAVKDIGNDGRCEVYENGYAVYDNGDRRTVVWVPDCGSATYRFTPLRDSEKDSFKQEDKLDEDVFGPLPWYHAVVIAGEDSIERNLIRPRSVGTVSLFDDTEEDTKPGSRWQCGGFIESPEEAYIRKETEREWREALTERRREAYDLYYYQGYGVEQIGEIMGISHQKVSKLLKKAKLTIMGLKKFF